MSIDVTTYCRSGEPILNGGAVVHSTPTSFQYIGSSGVHEQTASETYTTLENRYTERFIDPSNNPILPISTTSSSVTLSAGSRNIQLIDASAGNIECSLPEAVGHGGLSFSIKKIDSSSNTVSVLPSGSETIDGASSQVISTQYVTITVVSNGADWYII